MDRSGAVSVWLACGLVLCTAAPVSAYEDHVGLQVDLAYGRVVPDSARPNGALVGVTGSIGLDDTWTARARLAYGAHPATDARPEALQIGIAAVELIYLFDILEWVPYFGLGADVLTLNDSAGFGAEFGSHFVAGIDWLATRELVVGADLRLLTLFSAWDQRPLYMAFTLSVGWLFPL